MTEIKRYTTDNSSNEDVCLVDNLTGKEYEDNFDDIVDLLNEYDDNLRMCKEKSLYWRNKAEDIWGDMKTNIELQKENKKLKERIQELEQENKGIQEKVWRLIHYLEAEYNIGFETIKEYWNNKKEEGEIS